MAATTTEKRKYGRRSNVKVNRPKDLAHSEVFDKVHAAFPTDFKHQFSQRCDYYSDAWSSGKVGQCWKPADVRNYLIGEMLSRAIGDESKGGEYNIDWKNIKSFDFEKVYLSEKPNSSCTVTMYDEDEGCNKEYDVKVSGLVALCGIVTIHYRGGHTIERTIYPSFVGTTFWRHSGRDHRF